MHDDDQSTRLECDFQNGVGVTLSVSRLGKTSERTEITEDLSPTENLHLALGSDLARCLPVIDRPLIAVAHAVVELCGAGSTFKDHTHTILGDPHASLEVRELLNAEKDFLAEALRLINAVKLYDDKQAKKAAAKNN